MELQDQKLKLIEKKKPIPDQLATDLATAEQQFRKYNNALDGMRSALSANQNRLSGLHGQFVYSDKAFYSYLEMFLALEREIRNVSSVFHPMLLNHRGGVDTDSMT